MQGGKEKLIYNISNNNLANVMKSIKHKINEQTQVINQLIEIDNKHCKMKVNLENVLKILDYFEKEKLDIQKEQKILIHYNGNPCITINLCLLSILTRNRIILDCNSNMLGTNKIILEMINNTLKEYETDKLIYLINDNNQDFIDKIICIDNINKYNSYLREKNSKAKFYSLNYMNFYSDSEDLEELTELVYSFAEENQIPIESYSELEINEAIPMIKNGLGNDVIILTNNQKTKDIFEKNIKNKNLYINKNPFGKETRVLNKEILY